MPNGDDLDASGASENRSDDSSFKSPSLNMKLRERKRRVIDDDYVDELISSPSKRGRPKTAKPKTTPTRRPPAASHAAIDNAESDIFNALMKGEKFTKIIDKWIQDYERDQDDATVKFLQFLITATGCKGAVTTVMVRSLEFKQIVDNLSDQFDDDCGDYPLVRAGNQWKKFRSLFGEFIMIFVGKIKQSIIYDDGFTDYVMQLLTCFASSSVRNFRHTATFAAMKFSSALVDVVVELVELKEKNSRQIETEKLKLKQNPSSDAMEALLKQKSDIERKISELSVMIQYVFKHVFAHRYRDIVSDIRCVCISELGKWMLVYPELFLDDSYLKYVGWLLYDKNPEVRLKCVQTLVPLFQNRVYRSRLELFASKFKERVITMVMDKDRDVAVGAVNLITEVNKAFPEMLQVDDCATVYEAVYCANRALAQAAARFLDARLFGNSEPKKIIKNLLQFYSEGEVHDHGAYLVDSLIEVTPAVKDWKVMGELLLENDDEVSAADLIEILTCSVTQSLTDAIPTGRGPKKTVVHQRDVQLQIKEDKQRFTDDFIPLLPKLLNKFNVEAEKLEPLLSLCTFLELDLYFSTKRVQLLTELVEKIAEIFEKNASTEVLKKIVDVFYQISKHSNANAKTETIRAKLNDQIMSQFVTPAQRLQQTGALDDDDKADLFVSLKKLAALQLAFDLPFDPWDLTIAVLDRQNLFDSADVIENGVQLLFYNLLNNLNRVASLKTTKTENVRIKKRRDQFVAITRDILAKGVKGVENAFSCLCDVLIFFNHKISEDVPRFEDLGIEIDTPFMNTIHSFVISNVFHSLPDEEHMDQESQIDLTCKRRIVLGQYCKLIIYGILPVHEMSSIVKYYVRYLDDYGDILKALIQKAKDLDRLLAAKALIQAVINAYEDATSAKLPADEEAEALGEVHELAKKFSQFFPDATKSREAVAYVHQLGIRHALGIEAQRRGGRAQALPFFEILTEFSGKLLKVDRTAVLSYLDQHAKPPTDYQNRDEWEPYVAYRNSLASRQ
ncbi:unnamed protein product [Bursaphelenchus xylophilus]|uniref:(pine wood nematode) hypothetical protein n=1 Tax=Bursaphelenchus xylophilus TaxID=6326 RepID=A0A1I7S8F0_BURXY|nr:unnamed protein product [Bursaphelenchus xylophilus]CAG9121026.1 unnamed protein product [Bursaphelenchus xylophilus]